jgi:hypothetical protein
MNPQQLLDREFLTMRARILDLAAALDRLDRAEGAAGSDRRWELLQRGIEELLAAHPNRAERVQQLFSRPYDPQWRQVFGI